LAFSSLARFSIIPSPDQPSSRGGRVFSFPFLAHARMRRSAHGDCAMAGRKCRCLKAYPMRVSDMLLPKTLRLFVVSATAAGMLLSNHLALAAGPLPDHQEADAPRSPAPIKMTDVELQDGGVLVGRMVDARGAGLANSAVTLRNGNTLVAQSTTDANGDFRFDSVRGGIYHVSGAGTTAMFRVWAARTAPPGSAQAVMLMPNRDVVAGQWSPMKYWLADPLVIAGIVAVAAGVPIILAQQNNDSGS